MNTLLRVNNLSKTYGHRQVVNGISLQIDRGEIVGLLGPNGAGKTTSFYISMGLIQADAGDVYWEGARITDLLVHQRAQLGMGYLAQEPSIFRNLTVEENILTALETLPLSSKERLHQLELYLDELHLKPLRKKRSTTLSGGERRRLEITRALVKQPKLLLLDEPFANVDPITIAEVKRLILMLKKRGISVLICDHNAREILSFVDRAYLIYQGTNLTEGTPEMLMQDPLARSHYLGEKF